MAKKLRANIAPEFIGDFYTMDGKGIYQLVDCQMEPQVSMKALQGDEGTITQPFSYFANFIRLLPERPIAKPRKERSDKGTHKTTKSKIAPAPVHKDTEDLLIHVPSGVGDDTDYIIMIAGSHGTGKTLKEAVLAALEIFGGKIPDILTAKAKKQIQYILNPKKPK